MNNPVKASVNVRKKKKKVTHFDFIDQESRE